MELIKLVFLTWVTILSGGKMYTTSVKKGRTKFLQMLLNV